MIPAYIGIGSNLGDREKNIEAALGSIAEKFRVVKNSSLYETEPIGYKEQNWFLNCAAGIQTMYSTAELHAALQQIETEMGRTKGMINGPRIIDLDLLLYGNIILKTEHLQIPHPRFHERRFVLVPLQEIAAEVVHPVLQKNIRELLQNLGDEKDDKVSLYRKNKC